MRRGGGGGGEEGEGGVGGGIRSGIEALEGGRVKGKVEGRKAI